MLWPLTPESHRQLSEFAHRWAQCTLLRLAHKASRLHTTKPLKANISGTRLLGETFCLFTALSLQLPPPTDSSTLAHLPVQLMALPSSVTVQRCSFFFLCPCLFPWQEIIIATVADVQEAGSGHVPPPLWSYQHVE